MIEIKTTQLVSQLATDIQDILDIAQLNSGDLFVLGCSTSEIVGGHIGKDSNLTVGTLVIKTLQEKLTPLGIGLAVQGCEHINRSLVVERSLALKNQLDIVTVVPALHAGGACSIAAFKQFDNPVEVEHVTAAAGIDIGDTAIGMHVKFVQVPIRPTYTEIGGAHVTALRSRPKYVGGPRANYDLSKI
ncbi:TIGR01440 family protein [Levilactobacillus cerevisiae]|uniref:TIGR01440 family protein n=1 Tax=Levilactobacillus cerevisiae TaxID=1704076 RepID=UPI000F7AC195|nr:TIGR01440 family protein [Levilactobacillus cerevisiae]